VTDVVAQNAATDAHQPVVSPVADGLDGFLGKELDERTRRFVERQETMFVATYDDGQERECTFRVGPPGFVRVLDVNRVAWPEYAEDENLGVAAENPDVSLLFTRYLGTPAGLHLHGSAKIMDDAAMRRAYRGLPEPVHGQRPEHWVTVYVEEVHVGE
jgi:uncharacterized protein